MGAFRQLLNGLIKSAVLHLHIEAEHIAAGFAAEAVI